MKIAASIRCCLLIGFVIALACCSSAPRNIGGGEDVGVSRSASAEVLWDKWGVPHVFGDSDESAMKGLGYACAHDRGFQMYFKTWVMQGRVAEMFGDMQKKSKKDSAIDMDRKMRIFGFHRAAKRVAQNLDPETKRFLQAYSAGVNAYFSENADNIHPLFAQYDITPEPWRPEDCLLCWWHVGQFFASDGTRKLIAYRNRGEGATQTDRIVDDAASVVQEHDVSSKWVESVNAFAKEHGLLDGNGLEDKEGRKFSHAWVVGGDKSTTGSATLVSDPQTPATNPSLWYEFHISGTTFNARGIGVPGSPLILIGWNENVSWGATALGADQADAFMLHTSEKYPNKYFHDGQWKTMAVIDETIKVKGKKDIPLTVRETHYGPVCTEICFARKDEPDVAIKRYPICSERSDTVQGSIAMMRSSNVFEFWEALDGWEFPTLNSVFGDREGNVGFSIGGTIPLRSRYAINGGKFAHDGTESKYDWQGEVPHELAPHVFNPADEYILSGNHRPIGSFYGLPIGAGTGSGGDTGRSWRLRERLSAQDEFTPENVLDIHYDSVSPPVRDMIRVALYMKELGHEFSPLVTTYIDLLEEWLETNPSLDLSVPGAALADKVPPLIRDMGQSEVSRNFGGGASGMAFFLKDAVRRIETEDIAMFSEGEVAYVYDALSEAANKALGGRNSSTLEERADLACEAVQRQTIGYFEGLNGYQSLNKDNDVSMPGLTVMNGGCIGCQRAQSFTQFVPLHDVDSAMSILPIHNTDRRDSPFWMATYQLWEDKKLHPAPLSRRALEPYLTLKMEVR